MSTKKSVKTKPENKDLDQPIKDEKSGIYRFYNTILCLTRFYTTSDPVTATDKILAYSYDGKTLTAAKDLLLKQMKEAKIATEVEIKSEKNRKLKKIAEEIVKLFEDMDSKNPKLGWKFYPNDTELDVLILKTPEIVKYNVLVEKLKQIEETVEKVSKKTTDIDDGLDQLSKKTVAANEMKEIQEKTTDDEGVAGPSSQPARPVMNDDMKQKMTTMFQEDVNKMIEEIKENTQKGDSFVSVLTKKQKKQQKKQQAATKLATDQARKPMISGTAQASKTWAPTAKRAMKLNIAKDYSIDDLKKWCQESEHLKGFKLKFAITSENSEGKCVQVICHNWPITDLQFNDAKLWPTGARLRKWNDDKIKLYRQKPFFCEFIGNCGKATTKDGIKTMIEKAYGGDDKVHLMIEELEGDDYRKCFVARVGALKGEKKCPENKIKGHLEKMQKEGTTNAYSRRYGGTPPEAFKQHGFEKKYGRKELSSFT